MASTSPRIVVTGLGATTPLGGDVPTTWDAALAGRSGARTLTQDWVAELEIPVTFAASVAVDPIEQLARVETRRLDPCGQYALAAVPRGLGRRRHARGRARAARRRHRHRHRRRVDPADSATTRLKEKGPRRVFPLTVPMLMPNGPAAAVGIELGARAGVHTPVSACASGAEAIAYAVDMIRSGRADVVVAGGTEAAIHPLPISGFAAMQALSHAQRHARDRLPARTTCSRDGFVLGEGAGVVVLETEEHAKARGATIYAEIAGAGLTSDAYHIAAPEPEGAGRRPGHEDGPRGGRRRAPPTSSTSTRTPPRPRSATPPRPRRSGSRSASATDDVAVSATKSMTGHLLGAAGALESIFTILAVHHRLAPPTINVEDLDPEIDLDVVRKEPRALGREGQQLVALNNSFGFGGHNVALVVRSA